MLGGGWLNGKLDVVGIGREFDPGNDGLDVGNGDDVDEFVLEVPALVAVGDGGSSSSESDPSAGSGAPVVDGLLPGESGLSGPSSSLPGPIAPRPASCLFARVTKICIGVGRRNRRRAMTG